jgi:methionyl-tRNA synthetase
MVHRYRGGRVPAAGAPAPGAERLAATCEQVPARVDEALALGDFRRATAAVWAIVEETNRYVEAVRPWELARVERGGDAASRQRLDAALAVLVGTCRCLAAELAPFLPSAAARIAAQCAATSGRLPAPEPLFRRVAVR